MNPVEQARALMEAFHQGAAGNCASISVIKLALYSYGYDRSFTRLDRNDALRTTTFTLLDNSVVSVTDDELASVTGRGHFEPEDGADPVLVNARMMYAVMAKNRCSTQPGCQSPADAINSRDGYLDMATEDNFRLLGLGSLSVPKTYGPLRAEILKTFPPLD